MRDAAPEIMKGRVCRSQAEPADRRAAAAEAAWNASSLAELLGEKARTVLLSPLQQVRAAGLCPTPAK